MTLNARANQQSTVNVFRGMRQGSRRELSAVARIRCSSRHPGLSLLAPRFGLQPEEVELDFPALRFGNSHSIEDPLTIGLTSTVLSAEAGLLLGDARRGEARNAAALDDEDEDDEDDLNDDLLDEDDEEDLEDEENFEDDPDDEEEDDDLDEEDEEEE